jgi:hypothetical protein
MHAYKKTYMHTYKRKYIHTFKNTKMHTYIHINKHKHTLMQGPEEYTLSRDSPLNSRQQQAPAMDRYQSNSSHINAAQQDSPARQWV